MAATAPSSSPASVAADAQPSSAHPHHAMPRSLLRTREFRNQVVHVWLKGRSDAGPAARTA